MERYLEFTITENHTGKTIEQVLKHQAHLTRKQISQAKFRPGGIQKNGIQCRVNASVSPGDQIRICLETQEFSAFGHLLASPDHCIPEILYEDNDVIAVNKPAGILTHPAGGHYNDTLSNQLAGYFHQKNQQVLIRPVGRLDKETSGIVLFAKNQIAAARLQKQREEHLFHKQYLALTEGCLPADEVNIWHTVSYPIYKISDHPIKMNAVVSEVPQTPGQSVPPIGLQPAVTYYHTLKSAASWSLVSIRLATGRTHQIRVHMRALGHPLLGDNLYGNPSISGTPLFERAALHAWKVTFHQPFTDEVITLQAVLPDDFDHYLSR